MDFTEFKTGQDDINRRADKVIKKILTNQNLSAIYKAMRKGLIKINDTKIKPEQLVWENDIIKVASFLITSPASKSTSKDFEKDITELLSFVFKNNDIIFLNKPYGILVQKASKTDVSLDDCVKAYYKSITKEASLSFLPGPLHRLDKNTTGLIAFSWSIKGAHWFSQNIQSHDIKKIYIGIVEGILNEKEIWQDSISKNFEKEKKFQTVSVSSADNTNAYTTATPIKYGTYNNHPITVVEFNIKTGKTHQIRSQSAFHGHPLLGDTAYGGKKQNLSREYFLHAHTIFFPKNNPINLPEKIECSLLSDMQDFITTTCE